MRLIFLFVCACFSLQVSAQSQIDPKKLKFKPMFNGKNFKGWYSYLPTKGKNADPDAVFTMNDGLIHITGKEFGYLATEKSYSNFYMRLEFRWGTKKWPPRDAD